MRYILSKCKVISNNLEMFLFLKYRADNILISNTQAVFSYATDFVLNLS